MKRINAVATQTTVVPEGQPIFSELATHVSIDDEGGIGGTMKKHEWISRCAKRYEEKAGVWPDVALAMAHDRWDEDQCCGNNLGPEESADEDIACWTDDGEP